MLFQQFSKHNNIVYGVSNKSDGTMRVWDDETHNELATKNRAAYFVKHNIQLNQVVTTALVHGTNVYAASEADAGSRIAEADGLVTNIHNLYLGVTVADCFPVYFYEPIHNSVGLAHAGWRGIVKGIVGALIDTLAKTYSTNREQLKVGIGPGIHVCHFRLQDDKIAQFKEYRSFVKEVTNEHGTSTFIDLKGIINQQLIERGVKPENIEASDECTHCLNEDYFSWRRDRPKVMKAMIAFIGMKA